MNTAYPLITVSVIIFTSYFITWLFSYWNIFPRRTHLKFWNYILLITFLVAGTFGLVSVIKINYKIEIPDYEQYLKWHVNFGIAMALISFFHFFSHLSYYFPCLSKIQKKHTKKITRERLMESPAKYPALLLLLGAVSIINQIVFIREFISVLSGNELALGIVMANWMLLTGWGAFTGRKNISDSFNLNGGIIMLSFLALLPAIMVGLLYLLKYLLFPPGTLSGLGSTITGAFLLLFPVCFLSGYLFTAFSSLFSELSNKNLIGKAYALESFGSLGGSLLFSLLLGRFFTSIQIIGLTAGAVMIAGAWTYFYTRTRKMILFLSAGLLLPLTIFVFRPDTKIKKILFPNQEIILNHSTRYGNLVVTKQAGQFNFYENNTLQFYTENMIVSEEAVHFAMARHKNPEKILLISGGIAGMTEEIMKYDVKKITYLENNPEIFIHWQNLTSAKYENDKVEIIKSDIRTFLQRTKGNYDVILLNLPAPSTLGYNRFYTDEFFSIIKRHCNSASIVSTSLPSTVNYAEKNALDVHSSLWKTLGIHFQNLLFVPGEKNYYLASDNTLSHDITACIQKKGIETEYVNQYYLDDELLKLRSSNTIEKFNAGAKINHDFRPYMFIKQSYHWLSHFDVSYKLLMIIPALLFIIVFLRQNALTAGLYTGGFTASSLEITMMLAYQIFVGSIYLATAFFFTAFMGGLAAGSYRSYKITKTNQVKNYYSLQFILAAFALLLPLLINLINFISGYIALLRMIFFSLVFALAFGIGLEFNLASKLRRISYSETSGVNYSTDLAGSAFGAYFTALLLLPVWGLTIACFIVAALNILSGIIAFSARKKQIFIMSGL